jgi:GNAT superfamily N-acetyltransferase
MNIRVIPFSGPAGNTYISELARLRIKVFRAYPYLYDGDMAYEEEYLQAFMAAPDSLIVLAFHGDEIIGASTGMPMENETKNIQQPWLEAGYDLKRIFYYGESVLQKGYRGRGIGVRFFEEREQWARQLDRFERLTFCGVVRPDDHPMRPAGYTPLDNFWKKRGFRPAPGKICRISWKDLGASEETAKPLQFWEKLI